MCGVIKYSVIVFVSDSATGSEDAPSKTAKKTRGKKKGKSKMSIFDEDSPSIFDDPLNATSK